LLSSVDGAAEEEYESQMNMKLFLNSWNLFPVRNPDLISGISFVKRTPILMRNITKKLLPGLTVQDCNTHYNDSVQAGFAKVSITPALNSSEDNYWKGNSFSCLLPDLVTGKADRHRRSRQHIR